MHQRAPARSHLHRTTTLIAFLAALTRVPDGTAIAQPPPPHSATETFDTTDRMDGVPTTADWDTVRGVAGVPREDGWCRDGSLDHQDAGGSAPYGTVAPARWPPSAAC